MVRPWGHRGCQSIEAGGRQKPGVSAIDVVWGVRMKSCKEGDSLYQAQVWIPKVVLVKEVHSLCLKMLNYSEGGKKKKRQAKSLILKLSAELFSMSPDVWRPGSQGGHLD